MPSRTHHKLTVTLPPWLTEHGLDLSKYPIDTVLQQALSEDEEQFRTACTLLKSMSDAGRIEAGVFLIGLLGQYPENYGRLTLIAGALASHHTAATVEALASELRRVKGSSSTRGYLRRIIETLAQLPSELVDEKILELATDPRVGTRFRARLRSMTRHYFDE
jgi:hypothetical protein